MTADVPLKRLVQLRVDRARVKPAALLTLDAVESGTGRLLAHEWPEANPPPEVGFADAERGDILFGKLRPYLAKVLLVEEPSYASTELMCLRPLDGVNSRWLQYVLLSRPAIEWSIATSEGTKMPRTRWDHLATFRVRSTNPEEQRTVADYLDTETARIDALIGKKRRMSDLLVERWQGNLRRELGRLSGRTIGLRHIARIKRGQSPRPIDDPVYFDTSGSHGWVRIEDATRSDVYLRRTRDRLSAVGRARSVSVGPGTLLVSIAASVGQPIITAMNCCYHDGWVGLLDLRAVPEFVYLCLVLPETFGGLGQVGTQANINSEIVGRVRVPDISVEEQGHFARRLFEMRGRTLEGVKVLGQQIDLLHEHRQGLITAAVTGELEVPGVAA